MLDTLFLCYRRWKMLIGKYMGQSAFKHILKKCYITSHNFKCQRLLEIIPNVSKMCHQGQNPEENCTGGNSYIIISIQQVYRS